MQVIETIKFEGKNLDDIFKLECVDSIIKAHDDETVVTLSERLTGGRLFLRKGEYLCKFANGMWQVFGAQAYMNLVKSGKE